ncbi:MAG: hypothetical protein DCF22_15510 [Leptolyngbya sp.]|nr:MAG: hypothetical protein DCF22_15510 [Leptolyngbya sp.]
MERIAVLSREELLLQTLTELIQEMVAEGSTHYSILIEQVYAEFMRELLIQAAEAGEGLAKPASLLYQASHTVERRVQERLGEVKFGLHRYKETLCDALKAPAKELLALQGELKDARRRGEISSEPPINRGEQIPFQILEIGLMNSEVQGLIALPASHRCYLDFSQIVESCTVQGNWFPFELIVKEPNIGDLVFVVDQDGSINIHTENFPIETLDRTRNILKFLAERLYTGDTDDDPYGLSCEPFT